MSRTVLYVAALRPTHAPVPGPSLVLLHRPGSLPQLHHPTPSLPAHTRCHSPWLYLRVLPDLSRCPPLTLAAGLALWAPGCSASTDPRPCLLSP